ncbi:MAG: methylated-DNA--[protein]-cysteine S-methyltransferase [Bacteroidota bacterium]
MEFNDNYSRIEEAIDYIKQHFKTQPKLEEIAKSIHLSPHHFQRIFKEWAGVSPKKFVQYLSIKYAKDRLQNQQWSLLDTAYEMGLSSTARLHDLFVNVEGMTPGEYKGGGENLEINYSFAESPFGKILVASTGKGICHLVFIKDENAAFSELKQQFPNANFQQLIDLNQQNALHIFNKDWSRLDEIKLHLKGTDFQLKVWEALLKIPLGELSTYSQIAQTIEKPKASRAVGTAIGSNPIAYLIPCHRVIRSSGELGGYRWQERRKTAMIAWEAARVA